MEPTDQESQPTTLRADHIKELIDRAGLEQQDIPDIVKRFHPEDESTRFSWGYRINLPDKKPFRHIWAVHLSEALSTKGVQISPEEIKTPPGKNSEIDYKELADLRKKEVERLKEEIRKLKEKYEH